MAGITPPDPELFPTAAMRAAAWVRIARTGQLDEDGAAQLLAAVHDVVRSDERTDFVLLQIADLAGRLATTSCSCCGKPLSHDIDFREPRDAIQGAVLSACIDAAKGVDIDDRIRALDLTEATAHQACAYLHMFEIAIRLHQPTLPS